MLKSMTGFGRAEGETTLGKMVVESRSVNHRYCDINIKLHIRHAIVTRPQHAQERLRVHRARPDFHVIRLLQHAALLRPKMRELQNQILKRRALRLFLKFCFNFQFVSSNRRVFNFRSV